MAPGLTDLPVEVHFEILKYAVRNPTPKAARVERGNDRRGIDDQDKNAEPPSNDDRTANQGTTGEEVEGNADENEEDSTGDSEIDEDEDNTGAEIDEDGPDGSDEDSTDESEEDGTGHVANHGEKYVSDEEPDEAEIQAQMEHYAQRGYRPPESALAREPNESTLAQWWINSDRRALNRSPYNYASVSKLWFSILKKIPNHWDEVIIDVASDPKTRGFLDIFLWSKGLGNLTVIIINSHTPAPQDTNYSELERSRVAAVFDALKPHIFRCKSIRFEVAFATSLPSPVAFLLQDALDLQRLNLECKINNAGASEEYSRTCDLGVRQCIETYASFPALRHLSMTGFWFMFITHHPFTSRWLMTLRRRVPYLGFCITQSEFQQEGQYSIINLLSKISSLNPSKLELRDLSLNHDGLLEDLDLEDIPTAPHGISLVFKNLPANFIHSVFYHLVNMDTASDKVTIENCTLPTAEAISGWYSEFLILKNIPNTLSCSLIQCWQGSDIRIDSCPFFDDTTLSILGSDAIEFTPQYLRIFNCSNFTFQALRQLTERRNQSWIDLRARSDLSYEVDYTPLTWLFIDANGKLNCPFPTAEEQEWLSESPFTEPVQVNWTRPDPENPGKRQVYELEDRVDDNWKAALYNLA